MKYILVLVVLILILFKRKKSEKFFILKNMFTPSEIEMLRHADNKTRQKFIINHLSDKLENGYMFHDYIFVIEKSSIHTCHRDANGSLFNKGQKHPSFTMLLYLDSPGNSCLATVPGSRGINLNGVSEVSCSTGDIIVFDANMVHAGTIDSPGLRIQMKISHKDDLNVLSFYQNYHRVSNRDNKLPNFIRRIHQYISCTFPFISDLFQDDVKNLDKKDHKIFSKLFYGDESFYNLHDAYN